MAQDELDSIREELYKTREELATVKLRSTTVISGTELLVLLCFFPMVAAFVILAIIIVWKVTSNPESVGPYLDIILLALAVVANPVSAGIGALLGRYSEEVKQRNKRQADDEN
jgi:uncharacterized membrane protein